MTWDNALTALPIVIGAVLAWVGHQRAVKVDAATASAVVSTEARTGTTWYVDQLQEDNKELRVTLNEVTKERDDLKRQVTRFQRKYGNGENGP